RRRVPRVRRLLVVVAAVGCPPRRRGGRAFEILRLLGFGFRVDPGLVTGELRVRLERVVDQLVDALLLITRHALERRPQGVVASELTHALAAEQRHQGLFFTISAAFAACLPTVSPAGKPLTGALSPASFSSAGASGARPICSSAIAAVMRASGAREPSVFIRAGRAGCPCFSISLTSRSSTSTFL